MPMSASVFGSRLCLCIFLCQVFEIFLIIYSAAPQGYFRIIDEEQPQSPNVY